jgi:hypothetical protein
MYINAKKIPVETSRNWGRRDEGEKWSESKYNILIHGKNLCKCHNVPLPRMVIEGGEKNLH